MQFRGHSLGTKFQSNNNITTFNELQYFTRLSAISSAFQNCQYLTSVVLPSQLTEVSVSAFKYCYRLTSVTLHEGITTIGGSAFQSVGLVSLILPTSLTTLNDNSFYNSKLQSVTIGVNVTLIKLGTFQNCSQLRTVTILRTTPPSLPNTNAFSGTNNALVIYVPASAVDTYKSTSGWSTYASKIQAIPE